MEPVEPTVNATVPTLWENLIALNVSIKEQSKQRGVELSRMEKLLEKETNVNRELQATIDKQKAELLEKDKKIASLTSKWTALKQMILIDSEDERIDNSAVASAISVKSEAPPSNVDNDTEMLPVNVCQPIIANADTVQSEAPPSDVNMEMLPINVCILCDKKLSSSNSLKRHIASFHAEPSIPCPHCSSKFARSDYLTKHIKRVHDVGPARSSKRRKNN